LSAKTGSWERRAFLKMQTPQRALQDSLWNGREAAFEKPLLQLGRLTRDARAAVVPVACVEHAKSLLLSRAYSTHALDVHTLHMLAYAAHTHTCSRRAYSTHALDVHTLSAYAHADTRIICELQ